MEIFDCELPRWDYFYPGTGVSRGAFSKAATVLFWLALAFTLVMATLPQPPQLPMHPGDKVMHMAAFAALSLLAWLAFPRQWVCVLFAWMVALGAVIEVLQFIPELHRDADVVDWLADCGASLAVLVLCQCMRWAVTKRDNRLEDR